MLVMVALFWRRIFPESQDTPAGFALLFVKLPPLNVKLALTTKDAAPALFQTFTTALAPVTVVGPLRVVVPEKASSCPVIFTVPENVAF